MLSTSNFLKRIPATRQVLELEGSSHRATWDAVLLYPQVMSLCALVQKTVTRKGREKAKGKKWLLEIEND